EDVPHPKLARWKGQALKPEEVQVLLRSFDDDQDRLVFRTLVQTGVRRAELQALRWSDVDLIDNRLRVVDSKTKAGERSIALAPSLAEVLWQRKRTSLYNGDDNRVFCNPDSGHVYRYETFADALRRACTVAGIVLPEGFRPFHDLRVTSITNGVRANENPDKL